MSDRRAIVDEYLATAFPDASITNHDERGHHGRWWSINHRGGVIVLRVSHEFLTAHAGDEAQTTLERLDVARALRESAGRVVVLSRHGLRYVPAIPT
jgi:hypothetical protein